MRGADAVARYSALMDATEAQLADHNEEAFARLDARLALAEQRMKTKLEDARRRLLALDAGASGLGRRRSLISFSINLRDLLAFWHHRIVSHHHLVWHVSHSLL